MDFFVVHHAPMKDAEGRQNNHGLNIINTRFGHAHVQLS